MSCTLTAPPAEHKRNSRAERRREQRERDAELARWQVELARLSAAALQAGAGGSPQPAGDAGGRSTDRRICDTKNPAGFNDESLQLTAVAAALARCADIVTGDVEPSSDGERWLHGLALKMPETVREQMAWRWSRRVGELARCGRAKWLRLKDGQPESWRPMRCRDRLCAQCWGAAAAMRERDVVAMAETAKDLGYRLAFCTLTMRCKRGDPRRDVSLALDAWRMVRQRSRRDGTIAGGWRRLEVTWRRPKRRGKRELWRAHAHIHAVCLVPLDAAVHDVRASLVDRWRQACDELGRTAYDQSQDVDFADNEEATRKYLLKYLQKPETVNVHACVAGLTTLALRGRQLVAPFGAAHSGSLRAALPSELAEQMAIVRYERRDERARWSSGKLGQVWREGAAFSRLDPFGPLPRPPRELVELCAPSDAAPWHARQVVERGDAQAVLDLRLTPAALKWCELAGIGQAQQWGAEIRAATRARAPERLNVEQSRT